MPLLSRPPPAELLRENKRLLDRSIRELDRERMGLQSQEKKLIMEIKKMAKEGQMDAVRVMAKSLVRNRHAVNKMFALKSQLQAVSLRIATLKSTQAMADAMKGATRAMAMMNRRMNLPALAKVRGVGGVGAHLLALCFLVPLRQYLSPSSNPGFPPTTHNHPTLRSCASLSARMSAWR